MDPATLIALITGIVTIIQQCRDEQPEPPTDEELLGAARGVKGLMAIRKSARANGFRGRRFRETVRDAWGEVHSMSDDELMEVIKTPEAEKDEDGEDGLDYDIFG